jgi:hypothetical protein
LNNRRNQNSILFLTTLGVYLGLLVVGGAAPQVFAHSATTRNFELVDEIEVKDDLDKNPRESSNSTDSHRASNEDLLVTAAVIRYLDQFVKCLELNHDTPEQEWQSNTISANTSVQPPDSFEFRSSNNFRKQFIQTARLPRAGLDSLLAKNAK